MSTYTRTLYIPGLELVYTHRLWVRVGGCKVDVIECRVIRGNRVALSKASPYCASFELVGGAVTRNTVHRLGAIRPRRQRLCTYYDMSENARAICVAGRRAPTVHVRLLHPHATFVVGDSSLVLRSSTKAPVSSTSGAAIDGARTRL